MDPLHPRLIVRLFPSVSANPPLPGTPDLGTWESHSIPRVLGSTRRQGSGGGPGPARPPHPRVGGPAGPGCSLLLLSRPGLVEIRAVALRTVAIKGVYSDRYLCMGADGRMQGLVGVSAGGYALGCGTYACSQAGPAGELGVLDRIQALLAFCPGSSMGLEREDGKGPD